MLHILGQGKSFRRYIKTQDYVINGIDGWHVDGCQNYGPFLGTLNSRCRITIGIQKGPIILTATHVLVTNSQNMITVGVDLSYMYRSGQFPCQIG